MPLSARLRARVGHVLDSLRAVGVRGAVAELPRWVLRREFTVLTLNVRTHPSFQGKGIGVFAAAFVNRRSLERGYLRRAGLVARWNRHVLRYNLEIGATARGTVGYWQTLVRRVYFATGDVRLENDTVYVASP